MWKYSVFPESLLFTQQFLASSKVLREQSIFSQIKSPFNNRDLTIPINS